MGDEGALAGTLAVAEEQTAGRGRRRTFVGITCRSGDLYVGSFKTEDHAG